MDDYEIIPVEEVENLKVAVKRLKEEQKNTPIAGIATSLDHLALSIDKLFKIFDVAAVDIEKEKLEEKSFEEKIKPIMERLRDIEIQQKDLADGVLSLVDIVKNKKTIQSTNLVQPSTPPLPNLAQPPISSLPDTDMSSLPPLPSSVPPMSENLDLPPPPKKGFLGNFK